MHFIFIHVHINTLRSTCPCVSMQPYIHTYSLKAKVNLLQLLSTFTRNIYKNCIEAFVRECVRPNRKLSNSPVLCVHSFELRYRERPNVLYHFHLILLENSWISSSKRQSIKLPFTFFMSMFSRFERHNEQKQSSRMQYVKNMYNYCQDWERQDSSCVYTPVLQYSQSMQDLALHLPKEERVQMMTEIFTNFSAGL